MNYLSATMAFIVGLICLGVLIPLAAELSPFMQNTMGGTVVSLVSAMLLLIVILGMIIYWRSVMGDNQPQQEYGYD